MGLHNGRGQAWSLTEEEERHSNALSARRQEAAANRPTRFECNCENCGFAFQDLTPDATLCPNCYAASCF